MSSPRQTAEKDHSGFRASGEQNQFFAGFNFTDFPSEIYNFSVSILQIFQFNFTISAGSFSEGFFLLDIFNDRLSASEVFNAGEKKTASAEKTILAAPQKGAWELLPADQFSYRQFDSRQPANLVIFPLDFQ